MASSRLPWVPMIAASVGAVLVAVSWSCGGTFATTLTADSAAPMPIRDACELASHRCSRCHSLDRITRSSLTDPVAWRDYVHRMRLMPGSGIPPREEAPLTQCLVYRVAGADGLERLARVAAEDR